MSKLFNIKGHTIVSETMGVPMASVWVPSESPDDAIDAFNIKLAFDGLDIRDVNIKNVIQKRVMFNLGAMHRYNLDPDDYS